MNLLPPTAPSAQPIAVTEGKGNKHSSGVVLRRIKYALRFIYWTCKHRSTANARWVCEYEGYAWK